jgi:membrane protease YdiL (CAAX protease family)
MTSIETAPQRVGRSFTARRAGSTRDDLKLSVLVATAILLVNGAFVVGVADVWSRVVVAIAILGVVGFLAIEPGRRSVMAPRIGEIPIGLLLGLLSYAAAWLAAHFDPVKQEMLRVSAWPAGHSPAVIVGSVTVAVLGEEIFWRGTVLSLLLERFRPTVAILVGCALFAAAHLGSGTWLIPLASFGVVLWWNALFLYTRNLTAPFVCHLLFDLLVLQIAPLV